MVSFRSSVTASLVLSSLFGSIRAVPLAEKLRRLSPFARDFLKRSTPAAPYFVAYNDKWLNPLPTASDLEGYTVLQVALTFLLASSSVDEAQNWQGLTASQRSSYLSEYNAAGISLIVSAFGSTETPTSSGLDPVTTANTMAAWVITYGVQGIDVDYEDFTAFNSGGGSAETWLISYTQQLRTQLPQGQYILSHARESFSFSPSMWSGGGYLAVDKSVGSLIDWVSRRIPYSGATEYTTCAGLLTASSSAWPETALFQISANGVSLDKLVIGKPGTTSDASNGYIDPSTLASCVSEAAAKGWNAGVMVWQYPDATSTWITTVRGNTWPVSGSPAPTTTTTSATSLTTTSTTSTTSTASPTSTSPSGSCAGVSAWVNNVAYVSGNQVTYNGDLWTANQWNQAETPGAAASKRRYRRLSTHFLEEPRTSTQSANMHLILSSESVRHAVMSNESGQVLYKTFHPLKLGLSQGTTTIQKIKPNDDPMDMRDQFEVLAQIEWHLVGPSTFRMNGQDLQSDTFIPRHGILGRKRTFTGPDGRSYRWDMLHHTAVVRPSLGPVAPSRALICPTQMSRNDETRTKLVRYHKRTFGILAPKHPPYLDIQPEVVHMLDMIVVTFVYIEKLRMDKERSGRRNSGGGP
ncbi:hypothetical protein J3R83DRAFT_13264 [Lanmaoa asiatica]|nr:hypothetical protein J3R83DRAFT_13264 [Lanmaoa asiatica]